MPKSSSLIQFQNAFASLLLTHPLSQITVQDLVRKAGVNRSTFYRHFLNFDDFLIWLENELLVEITQQVTRDEQSTLDFTPFYLYAAKNRLILLAFLKSKKLPNFSNQLRQIVANKYKQLLLTEPSTIPNTIQAEFLIGGHISLISWWLDQDNPPTAKQMANYHQKLSQPK